VKWLTSTEVKARLIVRKQQGISAHGFGRGRLIGCVLDFEWWTRTAGVAMIDKQTTTRLVEDVIMKLSPG
jgi:hypothetical protein